MKILLAGGGTAGHINPAIAIANYIKEQEPNSQFLFVGTRNGLETSLVPHSGYDIKYIDIRGFERKINLRNFKNLFKVVRSCFEAKKIIREFAPDVIIGTGGYVSGPVLYMGAKLKIPTIIHESNALAGLTSKVLARYVDVVALAFPDANGRFAKAKRVEVTGNPIRPSILKTGKNEARRKLELDERPFVLAFGGSLGAAALNYAMVDMLTANEMPFQLLFATGKNYYQRVLNELQLRGVLETQSSNTRQASPATLFTKEGRKREVNVVEYIYDMDIALAAADLVICRCGATTISELCALGKASILIPSPNVTDNHQEFNGRAVANIGGGTLILEQDLTGDKLSREVGKMLDNRNFENYGAAARKLGVTNATRKIYRLVLDLK